MGVWGTGIYSNDIAEDVRDFCNEVYSLTTIENGNELLSIEFKDYIESNQIDNDVASFWYALSDWQWKHGILSETIRSKTLKLLKNYAGIEEWKKTDSISNTQKRVAALKKLRTQLESQMPPISLPKARLSKPKHKPGDIVIFKVRETGDDVPDGEWNIENIKPPFMFQSQQIIDAGYENICGDNVQGKYMAILCVGIEKKLHSKYFDDLYDEFSVYAWYDYVSSKKPTCGDLNNCGFLPSIVWVLKKPNPITTKKIGWTYSFYLYAETFNKHSTGSRFEIIISKEEYKRFSKLINCKRYDNTPLQCFGLSDAHLEFWQEKERSKISGISIDNLLNINFENPQLLSPAEIDQSYKLF